MSDFTSTGGYKFSDKPSPITGGWLPNDPNDRFNFHEALSKAVAAEHKKNGGALDGPLDDTIQALGKLIDDNAQLSMLFRSMFDEIPFNHRNDPIGHKYKITNYKELLHHFQLILKMAPKYDNGNMMVALPFTVLLEWPMATRGGLAAFLDKDVNEKMGAILNRWGEFLKTKESAKYITTDKTDPDVYEHSWLSPKARWVMARRDPEFRKFEELYKCPTPEAKNLGFENWDDFFTREFIDYDKVRPVKDKTENTITNGCESAPYAIKQQVREKEEFWVKGQPYSLKHMLDSDEDAKKFIGGTVYQAFLSPLTYHRWHSPINGTITEIRIVKGSYFSISPINAFPDPETFANTQSQPYLSAVATRALIYLHNETVGDMVMIPIGMVEVSTCEIDKKHTDKMEVIKENIHWKAKKENPVEVKKGDQLGMFHFGGSTHCLVFGPNVVLKFHQAVMPLDREENYFVPLNSVIADVHQADSTKSILDQPNN